MLFTDLRQVKSILEIPMANKREDKNLLFICTWASAWIEELLNRPGMSYKRRTEYYDGTGTQQILLKSRPVYTTPSIEVYFDEGGNYGAVSGSFDSGTTALTYGSDFVVRVDQEDGTSRSGILIRLNSVWPKRSYRQQGLLSPFFGPNPGCIKVVYSAGYTVDNMPEPLRMASVSLVAKIRNFFPLGMEIVNESYENRYISYILQNRDYLLGQVKDVILMHRNWNW